MDEFYYYRLLAEIVWGPLDKILSTMSWSLLDDIATDEQKASARKIATT